MDEFTSIAMWIVIAFLSVNITAMWINANSTVLHISGLDDTIFDSVMSDRNSLQAQFNTPTGNYVASTTPSVSTEYPPKVEIGWNTIGNTIKAGYAGWFFILQSVFASVPGGSLFMWILIPFLAVVQVVASFVIILRMALIVRGFIAV